MNIEQITEFLSRWLPGAIPLLVGGCVAIGMMVLFYLLNRPRASRQVAITPVPPEKIEKEIQWAPPEQRYADRRGAIRREGATVRVTLASSTFRNGVSDGVVIDRSTGGLRIAMTAAVAPGTSMQVRAAHAPDTVGFVTVVVRSCRMTGDYYEVGCEFEKTPPWNVLLLFG
jgi:hypothetical protein